MVYQKKTIQIDPRSSPAAIAKNYDILGETRTRRCNDKNGEPLYVTAVSSTGQVVNISPHM